MSSLKLGHIGNQPNYTCQTKNFSFISTEALFEEKNSSFQSLNERFEEHSNIWWKYGTKISENIAYRKQLSKVPIFELEDNVTMGRHRASYKSSATRGSDNAQDRAS